MNKKNFILLLLLACSWGPSFLFIKIAVTHIPPLTMATTRITTAALFSFLLLLMMKKNPFAWIKYWKHYMTIAIFSVTLPFFLIGHAEMSIPSALAGILNGSVPIFTAILAHFFIPHEKITRKKISGILLGFFGIFVIFYPSLTLKFANNLNGIILMIAASISYAIGIVYSKKHLSQVPGIVASTSMLFFATFLIMPFAFIFDTPLQTLRIAPNIAIGAIFCMALLGTTTAFYLFYKVIQLEGATYLSLSTLLFPLISIILGSLFLHEMLTWEFFLGAALILSGLFITTWPTKKSHPNLQQNNLYPK